MMALSRRTLLRNASLGMTALGALKVGFLGHAARASQDRSERRLVLVVMRGAVDALGMLPALGDPDYAEMRGKLAFQRHEVLPLDDFYGVTPALEQIHSWFGQRQLMFFPAISSQYRERSHFDGQAILESGMSDPANVESGWLGRVARHYGGNLSAVTLDGRTPSVLLGAPHVLNIPPAGLALPSGDVIERIAAIYRHDDRFASFADGIREAGQVSGSGGFGRPQIRRYISAGEMLAKPAGPRLAVISSEGWDTHSAQGTLKGGMFNAASLLAEGLARMREALGEDVWAQTVVLGVSEFGRTVRVNGSGGTDHGTGGFAFLAGGRVAGGRVSGEWPGLSEKALYQNRDLMPVTDVRSVIKAVLAEHLEVTSRDIEEVAFPSSRDVRPVPDLFRA